MTDPNAVRVRGCDCNRADLAIRGWLDAGPLRPAGRRVRRLGVFRPPERLATRQDAGGVARIEHEGCNEQGPLVEGVRNLERHGLPIPAPDGRIPELPADIAVAHGVVGGRAIEIAMDI